MHVWLVRWAKSSAWSKVFLKSMNCISIFKVFTQKREIEMFSQKWERILKLGRIVSRLSFENVDMEMFNGSRNCVETVLEI